ncbi:MAG: N-acetylmuramoyl-L-alanine amidase, partial [Gemmatimonadota bacterium]
RPLAGRRVAIDPGHPGAGATGPTGYYEGDANLAIGRILQRILADRGAEPILIRNDREQMGLYERTTAAEDADAEVFVSIHNNALPDGVRPFGREGTSTYYFHPQAAGLATAIQEGMLETMRLRDLGVFWGDLAVCRMSWMPSVLTEGAFMMMPKHEAALKNPGFQELYARGVADGIEAFLAARIASDGGGE